MKNMWCNCARFKWYRLSLQQIAAAVSIEGADVAKLVAAAVARKIARWGASRQACSPVWPSSGSKFHERRLDRKSADLCRRSSKIGALAVSGFLLIHSFRSATTQSVPDPSIRSTIHQQAMKLSASSLALFAAAAAVAPGVSAFAPSAAASPRSAARMMELFATKKVFIDGEAGTTGLQVRDRLGKRTDIEIISPPSELRKDEETRKKFINEADAVILCALHVAISITYMVILFEIQKICLPSHRVSVVSWVSATFMRGYFLFLTYISCSHLHPFHFCMHPGLPDAASIEASKMVDADNDRTVLIDASTAFRVNDEWTYGFPGEYYFEWIGYCIIIHQCKQVSKQRFASRTYIYIIFLRYVDAIELTLQSYQRISMRPSRRARGLPILVVIQLASLVSPVPSSKRVSFPRELH